MGKVENGIVINEGTIKKIKELYQNCGFNKEEIEAERRAMVKILPNCEKRINVHFEIAICDSDRERGVC